MYETSYTKGFTLFELIVTMMIIGVMMVFATARYSSSSGYDEFAYQARLISVLRNMQIRAMNDTRPNYCFQVNFDNNNNAFGPPGLLYRGPFASTCSTTIDVDDELSGSNRNRFLHMYALTAEMTADSVDMLALNSVGSEIEFIGFDHLGMPLTSDIGNDNCATGCTIQFSTEVASAKVCVESQGYVHGGECGG